MACGGEDGIGVGGESPLVEGDSEADESSLTTNVFDFLTVFRRELYSRFAEKIEKNFHSFHLCSNSAFIHFACN